MLTRKRRQQLAIIGTSLLIVAVALVIGAPR